MVDGKVKFRFPADEQPESDLLNAAEDLLNDIEAMKDITSKGDDIFLFSDYIFTSKGVRVSWPNLAISAAKLREALNEYRD